MLLFLNIVLFMDPTQLSPELRPPSYRPKGIYDILLSLPGISPQENWSFRLRHYLKTESLAGEHWDSYH